MLKTIDAYMYAFGEMRRKSAFWVPIALLYMILGSIREAFPEDWILKGLIAIPETLLYLGIVSVSISAITNKDYNFEDVILKPIIYCKACIISMLAVLLGCIVLLLPTGFILISVHLTNIPLGSLIMIPIFIVIFLMSVFIFTKFFFSQFYFFDNRTSIMKSLKESWKNCTYKVSLSILLSGVWFILLNFPLLIIDMALRDFYLHSSYLIMPVLQLSGAHMYMQLQNRKAKDRVEQDITVYQDDGVCR